MASLHFFLLYSTSRSRNTTYKGDKFPPSLSRSPKHKHTLLNLTPTLIPHKRHIERTHQPSPLIRPHNFHLHSKTETATMLVTSTISPTEKVVHVFIPTATLPPSDDPTPSADPASALDSDASHTGLDSPDQHPPPHKMVRRAPPTTQRSGAIFLSLLVLLILLYSQKKYRDRRVERKLTWLRDETRGDA